MALGVKSRMEHLSEGERNKRFFHRSVVIKRNVSCILCLRDDVGNQVENPKGVRDRILNYQKLYTTEQNYCFKENMGGVS